MHTYKELLEKFGENRTKHAVRFQPADAFTKQSMFKNHREYVAYLFLNEHKMDVIQHHHNYDESGNVRNCGLIYSLTDSVIQPMVEVWGIEGVSVVAHGKET